jgi:hypothetical protein
VELWQQDHLSSNVSITLEGPKGTHFCCTLWTGMSVRGHSTGPTLLDAIVAALDAAAKEGK